MICHEIKGPQGHCIVGKFSKLQTKACKFYLIYYLLSVCQTFPCNTKFSHYVVLTQSSHQLHMVPTVGTPVH